MKKKGVENYKRKRGNRTQKNIILVICCGETEVEYFKQFNLELGEIRLMAVKENRSPKNIVNTAISKRTE
ncbi:hypothetical protein RBH29_16630, partial [Herbivorax sp. ANBcel31]|nr:hypothetical protein [Herbivorax sp. ANBcel31]